MRTTILRRGRGLVDITVTEAHAWRAVAQWQGDAVEGVENVEVHRSANSATLLVRMAAGARFPMHAGAVFTVCQVVCGRGRLGLPGGREIEFVAPELYVFEPGTEHAWYGEEPVIMSITEVAP